MANTAQQIGGSIGTAVFSSVAASAISEYLTNHQPATAATTIDATLAGYHLVFWIAAAVFAACGIVTALLLRSGPLVTDAEAAPVLAH